MVELLVEMVAQAGQLVGVAQIASFDGLVEFSGEGVVGVMLGPVGQIILGPHRTARPRRLVLARAWGELGVRILVPAFAVLGTLAFLELGRHRHVLGRLGALGALGAAVAFIVLVLALILIVAIVGVLGLLVLDLQIADNTSGDPGEGILIVEHVG